MASYQDYLNQIDELKRKAEDARKQEMASAVAEIKQIMAKFGISPEDLGFSGRGAKGKVRSKGAAAYRDPATNKTWTGRGRRPAWLAGKNPDDFRIA